MTITIQSKKEYQIIGRYGIADIWFNPGTNHHSLHAGIAFSTKDIIARFYAASTQNYATYLTVQTGIDKHITLEPAFLQYVNHSCDPNVFFDTTAMQLVCIRPVQAGDELCFFYPSTEWEMAQHFICNCGSNDCLKLINGAAPLNNETISKYRLTDFILQQIRQKK